MYDNEKMNGEDNKVMNDVSNATENHVENTKTQERDFYNNYEGSTRSYTEPVKKKGKISKILGIIAATIGCGAVAGAIFFCVNYGLNALFKEDDKGVVDYKIPVSVSVDTSTKDDGTSLVMDVTDAAEAVMPAVVAVTSTISEELYYYEVYGNLLPGGSYDGFFKYADSVFTPEFSAKFTSQAYANNSFPLLYQTFLPHPFQHMFMILLIWCRLFLEPIISTPLISVLTRRTLYQNTLLCGG